MKYLYYPGCSLESSAREYDMATRGLMAALGVELTEIPDWTCCGASAAQATDAWLTLVLPAVNLAVAEAEAPGTDILVPCSACYLNLRRVYETARQNPEQLKKINEILSEQNLRYSGKARPRHLLDILTTDIGTEPVRQHLSHSLGGLRVAPYYGCQCLRPYPVFDDPETPDSMNALLQAAGADIYDWAMGARCCGASHMTTHAEAGRELVFRILNAAKTADAVATVCPMCQLNLEAYQKQISGRYHTPIRVPVFYLPQLLGRALGLDPARLGMGPLPPAAKAGQPTPALQEAK